MNTLLTKTANISLLALAALPIIALGFAHAASASIKISDLKLSRPADIRTFEARVDRAADRVCVNGPESRGLDRVAACREAVRAEAMEQLSKSQSQSQSEARAATSAAG